MRAQRLNQQSQSLYGTVLGSLHLCYDYVAQHSLLVGLLTVEKGIVSDNCLLLGPFSFYWVVSPSLKVSLCAWSYCILLCNNLVVSGRSALFWGKTKQRMDREEWGEWEAVVWVYCMREE